MIRLVFSVVLLGACRSEPTSKTESVTETGPSSTVTDTAETPVDTSEPPVDPTPTGSWSDCSGTLTLGTDTLTWRPHDTECLLEATTEYSDSVLTVTVTDPDACDQVIPWYLQPIDGEPRSLEPIIVGSRLALLPASSTASPRIAVFDENLEIETWALTSNVGSTTKFRLCWASEAFFQGIYYTADDNCDFLSCTGKIIEWSASDTAEHWTTRCGGTCPCAGIVTIEDRSETEMSGTYFGTNCSRTMSGTFTGVPSEL